MEDGRYTATIIVSAAKGDVRAARCIVSKAILTSLGRVKHATPPHYLTYDSAYVCESNDAGDEPRYTLDVTTKELSRIRRAINDIAAAGGWDHPPVDIYHE